MSWGGVIRVLRNDGGVYGSAVPGLCSNAFANASANAAFALAFDSPVMAAFAVAFDSSAFAFDSNAFD